MATRMVRNRRQGSGQLRFGRSEDRREVGHKEIGGREYLSARRSNERVDIIGIGGERAIEKAARLREIVRAHTPVEPRPNLENTGPSSRGSGPVLRAAPR